MDSPLLPYARLTELAGRYALPSAAVERMAALLAFLARDPLAPTSIREPAAAVDVHVADSWVALELEEVLGALRIADLGSGAGFPGLALAAALPRARVSVVESSARRCRFLERALTAAGLANVEVIGERAEAWEGGLARHDLVTARALAPLAVIVEYAAPLLRPDGMLVAWKGRRDADEEERGRRAAATLGLAPRRPVAVVPFPGAEHRHLHPFAKEMGTPPGFPRRPGVARKRPLGA